MTYEFTGESVVCNSEIYIIGGFYGTTRFYNIRYYDYREVKLYLFKGCIIDSGKGIVPITNCSYDKGKLTVTEDGVVGVGIKTLEDTAFLNIS